MIARAGSGWQVTLADLSLILFIVTASALSQGGASPSATPAPAQRSATAEPLAVWRPGGPALAAWLAQQPRDPRQLVTIIAPYAPAGQERALSIAVSLAQEARRAGFAARVVVEPGEGGPSATLAYDQPLARALQRGNQPTFKDDAR